MLLNKTDKARQALAAGSSAGLSLQDRRLLILTDGKRSLDQLVAMLGAGILPAIDRLMREDYIGQHAPAMVGAATNAARAPALGAAVAGLLRAATEAVQARTEQIRTATPSAASSAGVVQSPAAAAPVPVDSGQSGTPAPATRRSVAASKMYLLDMLQLQRSPEAAELRAGIQCAASPALLVDTLFNALRMLLGASNRSYGERILSRLAETLPEDALPRLEALRAEHAGEPRLSSVA